MIARGAADGTVDAVTADVLPELRRRGLRA
jgi:hypothetical protein